MLDEGARDCILPQPAPLGFESSAKGRGYLNLSANWPGCGPVRGHVVAAGRGHLAGESDAKLEVPSARSDFHWRIVYCSQKKGPSL